MQVPRSTMARWHDARLVPGLCGLGVALAALLLAMVI